MLNYFIAAIWLVNGMLCKVFNLVPRHQEIIGQILAVDNLRFITIAIGLAETLMAIWIVTKYKPQVNAVLQIIVIAVMNLLECAFVPHMLLWGRLNIVFAAALIIVIYYNQFVLSKARS